MSSRLQAFTMAFAALVAVPCLAGDLGEGVRFHERGDYAKAIGAFQRAAAKGEAEAQRRHALTAGLPRRGRVSPQETVHTWEGRRDHDRAN